MTSGDVSVSMFYFRMTVMKYRKCKQTELFTGSLLKSQNMKDNAELE